MSATSASVLVYNQGGKELLHRVSLKHAMHMLWRGVARILEADEDLVFGPFEAPKSLELLHYRFAKWNYNRTGKVPFSKQGVLRRDNYTCAYCGVKGKDKVNTVDHVLPKWQGNALTWNNAVAACQSCNSKKAGRTPEEAGMPIKYVPKPRVVTFEESYRLTRKVGE